MATKSGWQEIFLEKLAKLSNVSAAARAAKITREYAYQYRYENEDFAKAWQDALSEATENAEGELYRRAVHGTLEPVYQSGEKAGSIRRYSDTLLIFLLKAHRPEKYREITRSELTGPNGTPIQVQAKPDLSKLTAEELLVLRQISEKLNDDHSDD